MAIVYITNPTRMDFELQYRIPEMGQARRAMIFAGTQQRLPDNFSPSGLDMVIEQIERYGGVPHSDINAIVYPTSMVYRVEKPIDADTGTAAHIKDEDVRIERSVEMTEKTGEVLYGHMQSAGAQAGIDPKNLHKTSMEIEETSDSPGGVDGISTKIVVDRSARTPKGMEREGGKPVRRNKSS